MGAKIEPLFVFFGLGGADPPAGKKKKKKMKMAFEAVRLGPGCVYLLDLGRRGVRVHLCPGLYLLTRPGTEGVLFMAEPSRVELYTN